MKFRVLGTLEVLDHGGHPVELRGAKLRTLLAALVLRAGQPVSADELTDLLWGDSPPGGAANALQAQVSKLRRLLGDAPLETRAGSYVLAIDRESIDAERFAQLAAAGRNHLAEGRHDEAVSVLREGLALWRGPALADFVFDDFAQTHRTRLDEMRVEATEDCIDAELACGRHDAVAPELEALVKEHPLRERLWAQLMIALYRSGRQSESLRAFQRARDLLGEELGLEPGPALRELERQVLAQDAMLDAPVAAGRAPGRLSNIHPELSTFVGREDDVRRIAELLENRRLVTITGPGGIGKTRLATEIALHLESAWPDGTWLVELSPDSGERAVAAAFLRTFGPRLGHTGSDQALDWLTTGLAATKLLIVLDNCEHVLADAAGVVSALVRSCPGVAVLATSREALGLAGERVHPLGPLALSDAVILFADRAADSTGDFVLDDSSASAVETICKQVDRLPLAIELTAARTRAFSAHQLVGLLQRRFALVSGGDSGRPRRQQTMHAAVDWSFDLLFADERRLLTRLSVFAGGFTLDAVTRVCADDELPAGDLEVILARLVDKSLVVRESPSGSSGRFRLLRPVAEYAAERLHEANESASARERHLRWMIELTAGVTAGLRGRRKFEWAHLANAELANLGRAAEWGLGGGNPVDALRIGVNLGWYAFLSANVQTDEALLLELLDLATDAPVDLRCRALMWSGLLSIGRTRRRTWAMDAVDVARTAASTTAASPAAEIDGVALTSDAITLARTTGDLPLLLETLTIGSLHLAAIGFHPDALHPLNAEARHLAVVLDDPWYLALVTALDGLASYVAGDLDEAMAILRTAIAAFRDLGDDGTAALFEVSLSEVAELRGDIAGASAAMATALTVGSEAGFRSSTILRAVLCWLCGRNGEIDRAVELGREVVQLSRRPFNPVIRAQALFALGVAETLAGLSDGAAEHLDEALRIHDQVGMVREAAMDHRHLGHLQLLIGDADGAIDHHRRALDLAVAVGLPWTVMLCSRSLAQAIVDRQPDLACLLLGNSEALSAVYGYTPTADESDLVARTLAAATSHLGEEPVARAMAAGAELDFKELPALVA